MGDFILYKASCTIHQKLTSYIELRALRGPFGPAREHFKLYGTRRKAKRPRLEERFWLDDGTIERVTVPIDEHPYELRMPLLDPPGIWMRHSRKWPPQRVPVR
jgi:hypothetical protein